MENSIKIYGNIEINDEFEGLTNNPIQLEYYKIYNNIEPKNMKPYGIGITKTYCNEMEVNIEKREFNNIFSKEKEADNMLDLLIKNEVTPITLRDILEDFVIV